MSKNMATAPEKRLAQQLTDARMLLADQPKAKLVLSKLSEKPEGLNGAAKAYEFNNGRFLRMCFEFGGTWVELMPMGITTTQRESLSRALGFSGSAHQVIVPPTQAYLRERVYYIENKKEGGVNNDKT